MVTGSVIAPETPDAVHGSVRERRVHVRVRSVFDAALVLVEPCFDPQNAWSGVGLEHLAYRLMRERYPHLGIDEIHAFLVAAGQIYRGERSGAARCTAREVRPCAHSGTSGY